MTTVTVRITGPTESVARADAIIRAAMTAGGMPPSRPSPHLRLVTTEESEREGA